MATTAFSKILKDELETLPVHRVGEVLDYIHFLKTQPEQELFVSEKEQQYLGEIIAKDDWTPLEEVEKELL